MAINTVQKYVKSRTKLHNLRNQEKKKYTQKSQKTVNNKGYIKIVKRKIIIKLKVGFSKRSTKLMKLQQDIPREKKTQITKIKMKVGS